MDCVNHSGVTATAFCQNCGKAICANCVRNGAGGQILCEPCWLAWQNVPNPFVAPPVGAPNPAAAAVLGLIPGVGAMYNGQFFKGLIHVVIFAVLISITHPLRHLRDLHRRLGSLPVLRGLPHRQGAARRPAAARSSGPERSRQLAEPGPEADLSAAQSGRAGPQPGRTAGSGTGWGRAGFGTARARRRSGQPPYAGQYQAPYQAPYQTPLPGSAVHARRPGFTGSWRAAGATASARLLAAQRADRRHRPDRTRAAVPAGTTRFVWAARL